MKKFFYRVSCAIVLLYLGIAIIGNIAQHGIEFLIVVSLVGGAIAGVVFLGDE